MRVKYKMSGKLEDYPNVKVSYVWASPNWKNIAWYNKPIAFILSCIVSLGLNIMNLINGRDLEKITKETIDINNKSKSENE